jgi:hypothetical protein
VYAAGFVGALGGAAAYLRHFWRVLQSIFLLGANSPWAVTYNGSIFLTASLLYISYSYGNKERATAELRTNQILFEHKQGRVLYSITGPEYI